MGDGSLHREGRILTLHTRMKKIYCYLENLIGFQTKVVQPHVVQF